ncbi:MAG TPA: hypothetical protein VFP50_15415 [Anaeromyxobacteraceae bacterium]|nr:hypothetical protein [Anaeromyxobacteraceae bacterium]
MGGSVYDSWQLFAPEGDAGAGALDAATRQRIAAQAAALRRQEQLGTVASFTGDKVLSPWGERQVATARQGAEQLAEAPGQRLRAALERQRLAAGEDEAAQRALQADPGSAASGTARALLGKFMPKNAVTPNASAKELLGVLPLAEKAYQVDENSRNRAAMLALKKQGGEAAQSALSGEALDMLAEQFATTGKLPAIGMGKDAAALRMKIASRAAELYPDVDLAGAAAGYGADTGSLKKLQQQADAVDAFERTALANLDTFLGSARKVVDVGSPLFNAPFRKFSQAVAGNPNMAEFVAARQVAVQELTKVLSGAMGNAAASDSARHEAAELLSPDASLAQIEAAAAILKRDMANRKAALATQLGEIRGRVSGGRGQPSAPVAPAAATGKVRVTNGKETLEIDAVDLPEAEKDGYRRL